MRKAGDIGRQVYRGPAGNVATRIERDRPGRDHERESHVPGQPESARGPGGLITRLSTGHVISGAGGTYLSGNDAPFAWDWGRGAGLPPGGEPENDRNRGTDPGRFWDLLERLPGGPRLARSPSGLPDTEEIRAYDALREIEAVLLDAIPPGGRRGGLVPYRLPAGRKVGIPRKLLGPAGQQVQVCGARRRTGNR